MTKLETTLDGKLPLVICIPGIPNPAAVASFLIVGEPTEVSVAMEGLGELHTTGVLLTRRQALDFAVKLTELVGPLDSDDL